MKKIIFSFLLIICATPLWAQRAPKPKVRVEWGVIGGVNIPNFSTTDSKLDVKNKLGWQAGIITAVNFGIVAVEPQVLYMRQGMRIQQKGQPDVNLKSTSVDVPLLVSLRLLRPLRINAGPVFTVMNDCKQKSGDDLLNFGRVRPSVSYTVGLGVVILGHLLIDARYNGQFSAKKDILLPNELELSNLHSNNLVLSVGYVF